MRFTNLFLITILCITFATAANATDVAWSVRTAEESPFVRLVAVDGNDEVLSIACIKSDATDTALKQKQSALLQMKENNSLAILVREEPTAGRSVRMNLEFLSNGMVMARSQMGYVGELEAYFVAFRVADFSELFMEATTIKFQKNRPNETSVDVDISGVFRNDFASMANEHCHSSLANEIGLATGTVARDSVVETVDWKEASGWSSTEGEFFVLRHWGENGIVTQLSDGSGQAPATLNTLDKQLSASPHNDFIIDAGNRYFFRAPHDASADGVGSITYDGELSLLPTEDTFARPLSDAAALGDDWILAAGSLFRLSADDELINLSGTPAPGSSPAHLVSVGDRVIYVDRHPQYGVELFATDGTAKGTGMLLDINDQAYGQGRTRDSKPSLEHAARINNRVVFTATDGTIPSRSAQNNYHIWSSDGTVEGTLRLPTDGFYPYFSDFIEFEGRLYVTARPRGSGDHVLYSTDGTPAATHAIASTRSLVKAAGADPEKVRGVLGEPTRVSNRLIVPLLGTPLGREGGSPLFEISPSGEPKQLSVTSENIGELSNRLRRTGLCAGGMLIYSGLAVKESASFQGIETSTVLRSVDPDSGDTTIRHELRPVEMVDWSKNMPRRMPAADAVALRTRLGSGYNIVVTDGTIAGTHALSQSATPATGPKIAAFAVGNRRIAWIEGETFFSFDPTQPEVKTLFDPTTTIESRPGNAILGTVHLR